MKVTDVRITLRDDERLKGFVTMLLDDCFVVRGMKIIEAEDRLFLAMPNRRMRDGTYMDLVHPINRQTREEIERVVLQEYRSLLSDARDDETENGNVRSPVRPDPGPLDGKAARRLPREAEDWDGQDYASPA